MLKELIESNSTLAELAKQSNYAAVAEFLNKRELIANPSPQELVKLDITVKSLIPLLKDTELAAMLSFGKFVDFIGSVLAGTASDELKAIAIQLLSELTEVNPTGEMTTIEAIGVLSNEREELLPNLIGLLQGLNVLSDETIAKLSQALTLQIPDPTYAKFILGKSLAEQNGLGRITSSQVQEALNG